MNIVLNRSLTGVFCDDIRHEMQGKKSLIGCYTGVMEINEFPAVLAKFCAHVILQTPTNQPFRTVKLIVLRDDEEIAEGELMEVPEDPSITPSPVDILRMDAQFVFSPLAIEQPCTIRVRAIADGEELRGLALVVRRPKSDPVESGPVT